MLQGGADAILCYKVAEVALSRCQKLVAGSADVVLCYMVARVGIRVVANLLLDGGDEDHDEPVRMLRGSGWPIWSAESAICLYFAGDRSHVTIEVGLCCGGSVAALMLQGSGGSVGMLL